jgi:hypothetical protein
MLNGDGSKSVIWRRIRTYLVGVGIGLISCYFIFGTRGCKSLTPGMLKLDQLATKDSVFYSDTAMCEMNCQKISKAEVIESFTYGKIDTKKSQSFHVRYPVYNFTGTTQKGRTFNVICVERDSITRVIMVKDIAMKDSCKCN